jgi:acyl dehydratase
MGIGGQKQFVHEFLTASVASESMRILKSLALIGAIACSTKRFHGSSVKFIGPDAGANFSNG